MKVTIETTNEDECHDLRIMIQAVGMKLAIEETFTELRKIWKYNEDLTKVEVAEAIRDVLSEHLQDQGVTCID